MAPPRPGYVTIGGGFAGKERDPGWKLHAQDFGVRAVGAHEAAVELARQVPVCGVAALPGEETVVLATTAESGHAGCGQDCQATNFQPCGVRVHAFRKNSLSDFGWPPMSTSIAALPVRSATSPKKRALRSLHFTLLYFTLPDFMESIQLGLLSVTP